MNPAGLCLCGCGQTTGVYRDTWRAKGQVKGAHRDFVRGHYMKTAEGKDLARTLIPTAQEARHAQMATRRAHRHAKAAGAMMAKGFMNRLEISPMAREFVLFPRAPKNRGNSGAGMIAAASSDKLSQLFPGQRAPESAAPRRGRGRPKKGATS